MPMEGCCPLACFYIFNMASGLVLKCSSAVRLFLYLYVVFSDVDTRYTLNTWNKTLSKEKVAFSVSLIIATPEIPSFDTHTPVVRLKQSDRLQFTYKCYKACKIFEHALLALSLVALAGDVETNPGQRLLADIRKTCGLKVAHLNVCSLRNKMDLLRQDLMNDKTLDVLSLSETWLNTAITDSEIYFPGFSFVRRDRGEDKAGGGVIIYVLEGLPYRVRDDLMLGKNECIWIELTCPKCKRMLICCIYRAPDTDVVKFIDELNDCMPLLNMGETEVLLLGDFNVDYAKKRNNPMKQKLSDFPRSTNVSQLITEFTRVTETSHTTIDLIFVNNKHRIVESGVIPLPISDHSLVYCTFKAGIRKIPPRTIEYRSFKNYDVNAFTRDLHNVPWHILDNEENIDDAVITWNKLFLEIADHHAPIKKCRMKGSSTPWINDKLVEAMRDRDYHHRKAIKTASCYHWRMYKKLRNFVTRETKASKSLYYINLIEESKGSTEKIWKAVNDASARKSKISSPNCIISDEVCYTNNKSIAGKLNKYFVSIGQALAEKFMGVSASDQRNCMPITTT